MFSNIDWNKGDNDSHAERSRQIKNDEVKWFLLLPKFVLQLINAWPETQTTMTITLRYVGLFSLVTLLVLNVWYLCDVANDLAQAAIIFTTVNVVVQALLRVITLTRYQKQFAEVLTIVWKKFWLTNVLPENERRIIRRTTRRYFTMIVFYVFGSVATAASYNFQPMITGRREFGVMPKLPAAFYNTSPLFEMTFVCIWLMSYFLICAPYAAFDTFYCGLVYNCSVQFKMLRLRLNILIKEEEELKNESVEFQEEKIKLLIEYIQHHKLIIRTCDILKKIFQHFLLIQLLQSAIAICFCTFAGMVIPAVMIQMMIFSSTSILQLFLYCCFGNELTYQSRTVAFGAYRCGWHFLHHNKLSKLLNMLMHKAQLGEELSALGFTSVNYTSFITVLRSAFSFYTVLRVMLDKLEAKNKLN